MLSQTLVALLSLSVAVSASQIQSLNQAFFNAGIQGCIAVEDNVDGAPVVVHNCNEDDGDNAVYDWEVSFFTRQPAGPQQIRIYGDKCIDVKDGVNADGTLLQIWTCDENSANPNQLWTSYNDWTFRWNNTNKCIDLKDGKITDGSPIQIWTCTDGPNQEWQGAPNPDNTQRDYITNGDPSVPGGPFCITGSSNAVNAPVGIAACLNSDFHVAYPNGNITWTIPTRPLTGTISTFTDKCLSVPDSNNANGVKVVLQNCLPRPTNQLWTAHGNGQLEWAGTGKCLDLTDGKSVNGNPIQIWDCDAAGTNLNQNWFPTQADYGN
ncbi:ricin B lectin domain-containing protein [Mycena amicta]|nr:ricin B lectin domain-containing protein [Mycena amicta]KAJ7060259.1 ricin B lectin domain-containing protein [Mycena amicta]